MSVTGLSVSTCWQLYLQWVRRRIELNVSDEANAPISGLIVCGEIRARFDRCVSTVSATFIFIDVDKSELPDYLSWALKLSRVGTVIVGDNVVRDGEITSPDCADPMVQGVQRFLKMIAEEPRLSGTVMQTVGCKGWDGIALAVVGPSNPNEA